MAESYRVLNIRKHVEGRKASNLGECHCNACTLLPLLDAATERVREIDTLVREVAEGGECERRASAFRGACGRDGQPVEGWCFVCRAKALVEWTHINPEAGLEDILEDILEGYWTARRPRRWWQFWRR